MKKLLMAVAAVFAVASIASAASISWGDQGVTDKDGNFIDNGTAYLVYLGDNGSLDATFSGGTWVMGDDVVVSSATIYGPGNTTSSSAWGMYSGLTNVSTPAGSKYAVIVTDKGVAGTELPTEGYYGVSGNSFTQTKDGPSDTNDAPVGTFGSITASNQIQGVPEPTTYALIGIAAAALALRKRLGK